MSEPDWALPLNRAELIARCGDLKHSEEFVVMFLGYLQMKVGYREGTMPSTILEAWAEFKREMGKNPDGTMKP